MPTDSPNPVQDALTGWGVPWTTPMRELTATYGVTVDPVYGWEVVQFPEVMADVRGLLAPLATLVHEPLSAFPPQYFSTRVWVCDDISVNFATVADHIAASLGHAPVSRRQSSLFCRWRSGPASLYLKAGVSESDRSRYRNPSLDREPRLMTACSVNIRPGFRISLSPREREWLSSATVVLEYHRKSVPTVAVQALVAPSPTTVAYARDPVIMPPGRVNISADRQALIFSGRQLLVVPVADIRRVVVDKLYPARGSGGSCLRIVYTDAAAENGEKSFGIDNADGPDDLDTEAHLLGRCIDRPVDIGTAYPDV